MKFALAWLREYLETDAVLEEITDKLSAIGLEVEGVEDPAQKLEGFWVAEVLSATPHPDADKLKVLSVRAGEDEGEALQIVCGAPNARAGMKGVLGRPGARVPSNAMELRKSAIRGIESHGMMCSARELELGEDHEGIIELPDDAPVGLPFAQYHPTSAIIDVAITPNRPDCMGVYGIARDLAAAGLGTLKPLRIPQVAEAFACPVEIRTDDPEGCPAFYGRVIRGVQNGASPEWMQGFLQSAGQRPINALVDITNYVMLAFGRPAHAYDLAALEGPVVARRAEAGEQVTALNEKSYVLDPSMTVIADAKGVHDIAGIMGGAASGVEAHTQDVLLEIAYFNPAAIGVTGRRLGLASDARTRFERGVDPAFLDDGLALLSDLVLDICGGQPSAVMRAGAPPNCPKQLTFDPAMTADLGGVEIAAQEQKRILEALDFEVAGALEGPWDITCPLRRHDIEGQADLVEEVVRIHGLNHVRSIPLPRAEGVARPTATPAQTLERTLRRSAAGAGLDEAITWSFISENEAAHMGGRHWSLENPISEDMKVMRPSLLPGLLCAAKRNLDRGMTSLRLFEIGRCYGPASEDTALQFVLVGEKQPRGWEQGKAVPFSVFDAKALCEHLLDACGAPVAKLMVMGEAGAAYHPGQSATLRLGPKNVLARFGALHPSTLERFGIGAPVVAGELHLGAIPAKKGVRSFARAPYAPYALQSVTRDFAFWVPVDVPAGELLRAIKAADKTNITHARVFDVFEGESAGGGVGEGRKSLAIEVTLQPRDKSYTDADLQAISERVIAAAAKQGGELRG